MVDEWIKQIVAVLLGIIGAAPFFAQAWRDRRTREKLQRIARGSLDGWGDALALVQRYLIVESEVDEQIKNQFAEMEKAYHQAWREYSGELAKDG